MENNINGNKRGFDSFNNNYKNNAGINLSNLFDLKGLTNLFGMGGNRQNPLAGISRMLGMNNNNNRRQYRSQIRILPIEEAYRVIKNGMCFLLDVRTPMEYNTVRIKGSVNIPLDKLQTDFPQMVTNKSENIIVYCATGSRVRRAVQILWSLGYTNICIWEGAGINTFAFADLIVYNDRQLEQTTNTGGNND